MIPAPATQSTDDDEDVIFGTGAEDFKQAEWLSIYLENRWRYDHVNEKWHHWNGVVWAEDKTDLILMEVARLAAHALMPKNVKPPIADSESSRKAALKLFNLNSIKRALESLATFPSYGTDGSDWDQIPHLLGCKNGIVDLRTGQLDEHPEPSCLVTKTTGHKYVPLTEGIGLGSALKERAPVFFDFIDQVTSSDPEMINFLLSWFGAGLFGFTPEQRFLIMTGIGRNGKGALQHSVMRAIGEYAAQPDSNLYSRSKMGPSRSDGARADLMALKGKRITFMSEPAKGEFNEEMLKAHTGGDTITARALYSNDLVSWVPTHSITFLVNDAPSIEDVGPSMAARVMVADFRERYDGAKEDKSLYSKLEKEADGILSVLVFYAKAWYAAWESGEGGLVIPDRVVEQSKHFIDRNDPLAQWLDEACRTGESERCNSSLAWESLVRWHNSNNIEGEALSQTKLSLGLMKKGFRKEKTRNGNVWHGFSIVGAMEIAMRGSDD